MADAPSVKDLLQRNAEYQEDHSPLATFKERFGAGFKPPSVAIITCADPRCIPEKFLKLNFWDAVVIRNVGSDARAALPTLCAIAELAGLKEVMVINHTDCGATMYRDDGLKKTLRERASEMSDEIDKMEFGAITTPLEDRGREHVAILKKTPLLKADLRNGVMGYIYDIKDGSLKQIE